MTIADAGPLIALLDESEPHHRWVIDQTRALPPRLLTCEAVLAEVHYVARGVPSVVETLATWLARGRLTVAFNLQTHYGAVYQLMEKFADVPMSLADACLVRMAELNPGCAIFTLDSDFRIYRKNQRETIPLIAPW